MIVVEKSAKMLVTLKLEKNHLISVTAKCFNALMHISMHCVNNVQGDTKSTKILVFCDS